MNNHDNKKMLPVSNVPDSKWFKSITCADEEGDGLGVLVLQNEIILKQCLLILIYWYI